LKIGIKKMMVLGGSVLLSGILGELILQNRMPDAAVFFVQKPNAKMIFRPDPKIMPGIFGPSHYQTNFMGLRGDMPLAKGFNILAIGGSTTEDVYLDQSEAWTQVLQKRLNEQIPGTKFWVGNAGKSGMDAWDHQLVVGHIPPQIKNLGLIIILVGVNDLARSLKYSQGKTLPVLSETQRYHRNFYLRAPQNAELPFYKKSGYWRLGRILKNAFVLKKTKRKNLVLGENAANIQRWRKHRKGAQEIIDTLPNLRFALKEYAMHLNHIIDVAQKQKISLLMVTQPVLWEAPLPFELNELIWMGGIGNYQEDPNQRYYSVSALEKGMALFNGELIRICQLRKTPFLDLAPLLEKNSTHFYDDCHFNELGAKVVARALVEFLIANQPGPWSIKTN